MRTQVATAAYLGLVAVAHADGWQLEELPAPPAGWYATPVAISTTGKIVGNYSLDGDSNFHAFVLESGRWTSLSTLGGTSAMAEDVNARGQIVGTSDTNSISECFPTPDGGEFCFFEAHAVVWRKGVKTDLGTQGSWSSAYGVNDQGWIVGVGGEGFAQRWSPEGRVHVFGTFGGGCLASTAAAINSDGQIVGQAATDEGFHAFLWDEVEGPRLFGTLGGPTSAATAISDAGHVVGNSETATAIGCETNEFGTFCIYEQHPFLWQDGQMIDLGTLGGPNAFPRGVNSRGEIVGYSETSERISCHMEGGIERCKYRYHAFVRSNGTMIDLGEPGLASFANGINERGDIVGIAELAPGSSRPVIWRRR